jgi:hypothetical protein
MPLASVAAASVARLLPPTGTVREPNVPP